MINVNIFQIIQSRRCGGLILHRAQRSRSFTPSFFSPPAKHLITMNFSNIPTTLNNCVQPKGLLAQPPQVPLPPVIVRQLSRSVRKDATPLGADYTVGPADVVCGRGKGFYNQPGNRRFRAIVWGHVPAYQTARTKMDKSLVLSHIVEAVQEHGRFVKRRNGVWIEIGEEQAREKVGHAIREAMANGVPPVKEESVPPVEAAAPMTEPEPVRSSSFSLQWSDIAVSSFDDDAHCCSSNFGLRSSVVLALSSLEDWSASV